MSAPKRIVLSAVVLTGISALVSLQQRTIQRMRAENARLAEAATSRDQLPASDERSARTASDAGELERAQQSELLRLRGEVARLRRQIQDGSTNKPAPSKPARQATANEQPAGPVGTYVATTRAAVAPRQTLVTGGWAMPSGKRTVVLVQPDLAGEDSQQVQIEARFIELPEEVLAEVGLDAVKSEDKQSASQLVLTSEQTEALLKALENTPGVDVLTSPRMLTLAGQQAQLKMVETRHTPAGDAYETGPSVDILPSVSADRTSIELGVIAQLRLPNAPSP
jgi:hypothetical protein